MGKVIVTILVIVGIILLVFLILREVMCWYWKINERITLQQETNLLLKKLIDEEGSYTPSTETTFVDKKPVREEFCPICGHKNEFGAEFCTNCSQRIE
ncbi:MAG: zinc ribbon domain-containing protein [Dysgonamonadaceae bacterium]